MSDKHNNHHQGVSNMEIDWLLRGQLPEATTPMPKPKKHVDSTPSPATPPPDRPIQDAVGHIRNNSPAEQQLGHVLSRSKSLSALENGKEKKGFFKSLFGRKKNKGDTHHDSLQVPATKARRSASPEPQRVLATDGGSLHKSKTSSSQAELDPRLEEFLRHYKSKGLDKLQKDTSMPDLTTNPDIIKKAPTFDVSDSDSASITSSAPSTVLSDFKPNHKSISQPSPAKPRRDVLGRPIPPHPAKAPRPPAIVKSHFEAESKPEATTGTSRLTGFLKRHHTASFSDNSLSRVTSASHSLEKSGHNSDSQKSSNQPVIIPGLEDLPALKRVSFDVPVFYNDPPQQIPSRTPRKGEVEILKDGSIVIHKLSAAERRQIMTQGSGGLVVGGSGHLKVLSHQSDKQEEEQRGHQPEEGQQPKDEADAPHNLPTDNQPASSTSEASYHDAQAHSIKVAAAAAAAEARGTQRRSELCHAPSSTDEDVSVSASASKINIETPMVRHNKSAISLRTLEQHDDSQGVFPPPDSKVPLDVLYTRCCHLREILPVPATLKQLTPGSTEPISLLQLRNPKPSLIEVLTFSDFISVAPVLCVSLDGVSLSSDMFRIILASLTHKKEFEKLTLRNTPLDDMGWRLLCWFLNKNRTLSRLDLTQVPSLHTGVQKPAKSAAASTLHRMECDMQSRSDMNWNLLSTTLAARGGLDELVINGAKMTDEEFKMLIELGVVINTTKLGVAYNDLSHAQIEVLAQHLNTWKVTGLDMGYNDLSDKLEPLLHVAAIKDVKRPALQFLSLNSCNLNNDNHLVEKMFNEFAVFRDMKYIDLSNNKRIFPSAIVGLTECLPIYPKLARIHLDYNDLSQGVIVAFAELIPFCKSLRYISLVGNHINAVSASALTNAVKLSKSVMNVDLDYDELSPKFRESIGLYTVRNMHSNLYNDNSGDSNSEHDKEISGLREQLSHLLLHAGDDPDPVVIEKFIKTALRLRQSIHEYIEELFHLRLQGKLNVEGKEALIRFYYIDASIEKGLSLLTKRSAIHQIYTRLQAKFTDANEKAPDHRKMLGAATGGRILDSQSTGSSPAGSTPMSRQSSGALMSSLLDGTGHSELLPFGVAQKDSDSDDDKVELLKEDHDVARSSDALNLKEEGSALKVVGMIRKSGISNNLSQEDMRKIEKWSGDQLRDMILETNDYINMGDVLEKLKSQGIAIGEIYSKDNEQDDASKSANGGILDLETLKNTASNTDRNTIFSEDDVDTDDENPLSDQESVESEKDDEVAELGHAYDEILDQLEKTRTNN